MRKLTLTRPKRFYDKWNSNYIVVGIPQDELAEYTGLRQYALGFDEALIKSTQPVYQIDPGATIRIEVPSKAFFVYGCYLDSSGIRFGPVLEVQAGEKNLDVEVHTRIGLRQNNVILTLT